MSMKKLWATVLTGLLGFSTVALAADPVSPGTLAPIPSPAHALQTTPPTISPYAPLPALPPVAATPASSDPVVIKKKIDASVKADTKAVVVEPLTTDPKAPQALKPVETKWSESKTLPGQAHPAGTSDAKPLPKDTKPGDLQANPAPAVDSKTLAPVPAGASSCGSCMPCPKPCAVIISCTPCPKPCAAETTCPKARAPVAVPAPCAKPCATCSASCGLGGGKLRGWLTYRPCRTRLGECAIDYRQPSVYTFFLDTPCRETWKPVACCNKPSGHRGGCQNACAAACGVGALAPHSLPELLPAPMPSLVPDESAPER
jgi:hypothetical protein